MPTVKTDRLARIESLVLASGSHSSFAKGACVMEAVAYVAGEKFSDHPSCASPVIAAYLRSWNDRLDTERRQELKQYITRLVGSAGTAEQEDTRRWLIVDWLVHQRIPELLRVTQYDAHSAALAALPTVDDRATYELARPALQKVRDDLWPIRVNRWNRIREAVYNAVKEQAVVVAAAAAAAAAAAHKSVYWPVYHAVRATVEERLRAAGVRVDTQVGHDLVDRLLAVTGS